LLAIGALLMMSFCRVKPEPVSAAPFLCCGTSNSKIPGANTATSRC